MNDVTHGPLFVGHVNFSHQNASGKPPIDLLEDVIAQLPWSEFKKGRSIELFLFGGH